MLVSERPDFVLLGPTDQARRSARLELWFDQMADNIPSPGSPYLTYLEPGGSRLKIPWLTITKKLGKMWENMGKYGKMMGKWTFEPLDCWWGFTMFYFHFTVNYEVLTFKAIGWNHRTVFLKYILIEYGMAYKAMVYGLWGFNLVLFLWDKQHITCWLFIVSCWLCCLNPVFNTKSMTGSWMPEMGTIGRDETIKPINTSYEMVYVGYTNTMLP